MTIYKTTQPDFWLEIRKEYIIENFEKLIHYLRKYQYFDNKEIRNSEFLNSCQYLIELAEELSEFYFSHSFISHPSFKLSGSEMDVDDILAYRIIVAAILASQKIGKDQHKLLSRLINILVVAHKMPRIDIADDLIIVTINCYRRSPIISLSVKWEDIENNDSFSPIRLLHNLSRTKFDQDKGTDCLLEGKGTVVFSNGELLAAPLNKSDFFKETLTSYITIGKTIKLLLPKSDHMRTPANVDDVDEGMVFMTRVQGSVKQSQPDSKRRYSSGMIIPVKIKSNYGVKIEATTIDPGYVELNGKVNIINVSESLRYADIFQVLDSFSVGTILLVEYTPDDKDFIFQLKGGFNQFYYAYADQMKGEDFPGVYIDNYSAGTQWLTLEGFVANVMGEITNEDQRYAMENNIPLTIRLNSLKKVRGAVLVNGSIVDDNEMYGCRDAIVDIDDYKNDCFTYLFGLFLKYCADVTPTYDPSHQLNEIPECLAVNISNILMEHQRLLNDTLPRLTCLQVALMLSITAGDYRLSAYIRHELEYQIAIARFAGGASPISITLSHGPVLDGVPEVEKHEHIISMLRNYKEPEIGHVFERHEEDENIEDTVDGLIDASNRLIGKIDDREISRIKLELARTLDVDDQFRSKDETTYYGVESDTLEFKTSAVCPPKNKLKGTAEYEPETQKWAILKTICGFLNSTTGGELLIGVRDNGLASGIQHDYTLLYEDRRIPEANSDRYRTYLKNIIDNAFIAYKSRVQKSSVTTAYVAYSIETNNEGVEILRIKVESYRGDMVYFHPDCIRPNEIEESYIRASGATIPMSNTVRDQTLLKKYHLAGDKEGHGMAAIYQARNSKKRVLLKGYTSRDGIDDREIEVIQVFPESKCVLGYDTEAREPRLFKSTRWKDAFILDKPCTQSTSSKTDIRPDIFGYVFDPSKTIFNVEVGLTNYGAMLLQEEYPGSTSALSKCNNPRYPWLLNLSVNTLEGIARFVRGLPLECLVEENSELGSLCINRRTS